MEKPKIVRQELDDGGLVISPHERVSDYYDEYVKAKKHLSQGEIEAAMKLYAGLSRKEPSASDPFVGLAACHTQLGNFQAAAAASEKALLMDPRAVAALIALGTARFYLGEANRAAESYRAALTLDSDCPDAHWGLVLACAELGEKDEARQHLERYKALVPGSPRILELKNWLDQIE